MSNTANVSAFVSLGSNLGDRAGNLLLGIRGILDAGLEVSRLSNIYESEPVETVSQPYFLNMVAELRGNNLPEPEQLLARLLRVEYSLGRKRDIPKGPRTIDLDLLLHGEHTSGTEFLTLPHPRLHHRRFVLTPLAELAPNLVHPKLKQSIGELLEKLDDSSAVKLWGMAGRWGGGWEIGDGEMGRGG